MVLQQHVCGCVGCTCVCAWPCFHTGNRATHRQPRNGTDTISTGRTPATEHRYNLPEDGLDRLKNVGVVGIILTK